MRETFLETDSLHLYSIDSLHLYSIKPLINCKTSKSGAQIEPDHKCFVTDKYRIFRFVCV